MPADVGVAGQQRGVGHARDLAAFELALLGVVPPEEARVDDDPAHDAGQAETDEAPVVAGAAAAPGLPAVHPFAAIGVLVLTPLRRCRAQERLLRREELVVRQQHRATQPLGGEVDQLRERDGAHTLAVSR